MKSNVNNTLFSFFCCATNYYNRKTVYCFHSESVQGQQNISNNKDGAPKKTKQ